ncbi:MAG TPA: hypothetical protein VF044_09420 [Actinomycetota bacterium]
MDDYSALAQRVAVSVGGVRGSLILSRDGLILGAFPDDESAVKPAWLRFAALGEPQRGFVEFGDQIWAYVHRGPYASFVVAGTGARPGVLIDRMEQALLAAEEARTKREPLRVPDPAQAPSGKPRTSLHPPAIREQPAEVAEVAAASDAVRPDARAWRRDGVADRSAEASAPHEGVDVDGDGTAVPRDGDRGGEPDAGGGAADPRAADAEAVDVGPRADGTSAPPGPGSSLQREPRTLAGAAGRADEDEAEIDRVMLAKEFSGLLQADADGDEETS